MDRGENTILNDETLSGRTKTLKEKVSTAAGTENVREKGIAVLLTFAIIGGLVVLGSPAGAVVTTLDGPDSDVNKNNQDTITFNLTVEIEDGERVPIGGYQLTLTDADTSDEDTLRFHANGSNASNAIGGDNPSSIDRSTLNQSLSVDSVTSPFGYGDLSGYDNNQGFGYGYGYGYDFPGGNKGYGYGYDSNKGNKVELTFTVDADAFDKGDYEAQARIIIDDPIDDDGSPSNDNTAYETGTESFTVTKPSSGGDDTTDDTDDDDDDDDTTGGTTGDDDTTATPEPDTGEDEEPVASVSVAINDTDPDEPGVQVDVGVNTSVRTISFSNESASGSVSVDEFDDVPADTPDLPEEQTAATVVNITVPADNRNESATVETEVTKQKLEDRDIDPDTLTAYRFHDGEWQSLETDVRELENSYLVEYETPGFSKFAIAGEQAQEQQTTPTPTPVSDEPTPTATKASPTDASDDDDDGISTLTIVGLVVLLLLLGIGAYAYTQREEQ